MPEIAPAAPATPVLPAAPTTPVGAAPAIMPDAVAHDFLCQLKAALKTLAGAVKPQAATPAAAQVLSTAESPSTSTPTPTPIPAEAKSTDKAVDSILPEMLAALGLVTVPTTVQPLTKAPVSAEGSATPVLTSATTPLPQPTVAAPQLAGTTDGLPTQQVEGELPKQAHVTGSVEAPAVQPPTPTPTPTQAQAQSQPIAAPAPASTPSAAAAPMQPQQTTSAVTNTAAPTPTSVVHVQPQAGFHQEQNSQQNEKQHTPTTATSTPTHVSDSSSVSSSTSSSAPVVDQTMVAAATAATPSSQPVQTAQVHPADVVSQIFHQADLYRLPGNKGVRINLHPEDLGGLQVTLRYASGGSLELHINVEHAATGALVQAGWTQLRDALATQGIAPERLVMSVSGPSGSNQLDFGSNSNGSYRPDPGLAAFTQGGNGGQRQGADGNADGTGGPGGWTTAADAGSASDDTPRVASVISTSRIDYRV